MPNKNWEEQLAMELTHSEQGFYYKNLELVRKMISNIRLQDRDNLLEIADSGEFEDMRREVTNYYNN